MIRVVLLFGFLVVWLLVVVVDRLVLCIFFSLLCWCCDVIV